MYTCVRTCLCVHVCDCTLTHQQSHTQRSRHRSENRIKHRDGSCGLKGEKWVSFSFPPFFLSLSHADDRRPTASLALNGRIAESSPARFKGGKGQSGRETRNALCHFWRENDFGNPRGLTPSLCLSVIGLCFPRVCRLWTAVFAYRARVCVALLCGNRAEGRPRRKSVDEREKERERSLFSPQLTLSLFSLLVLLSLLLFPRTRSA